MSTIHGFLPTEESQCFPAGTSIRMADGSEKPIEEIRCNDCVLAFDPAAEGGRGSLVPRTVNRLFINITEEWLILRPVDGEGAGFAELVVTPGHHFLAADGTFRRIDEILRSDGRIVLASGLIVGVTGTRVAYSGETADHYEQTIEAVYGLVGGLALVPHTRKGWKTYNFEVDGLHTYVAGGVRVHNQSDPRVVVDVDAAENFLGRPVDDSAETTRVILEGVGNGQIPVIRIGWTDDQGQERFWEPFAGESGNQLVIAADENSAQVATVSDNIITRLTGFGADGTDVLSMFTPDGGSVTIANDTANQNPWAQEFRIERPNFDARYLVPDTGPRVLTINGAELIGTQIGGSLGSTLGSTFATATGAEPARATTPCNALAADIAS
jgi:hypothetical protein